MAPELFVAICDEGLISIIVTIIVIVRYEKSHTYGRFLCCLNVWIYGGILRTSQMGRPVLIVNSGPNVINHPNKEFVVGICWVYRCKM